LSERKLHFVRSYLVDAGRRIELAEICLERRYFHLVVRLCQEAIELCLKAVLRFLGIEYPRAHDVGYVLRQYRNLFPEWFRVHVDELARISRDLAHNRGPAMYGDEEAEIPPEELYDEVDAREAIKRAKFVYELCSKLVESECGR